MDVGRYVYSLLEFLDIVCENRVRSTSLQYAADRLLSEYMEPEIKNIHAEIMQTILPQCNFQTFAGHPPTSPHW